MLTLRTLKELIDTPKRGEKLPTPKQLRTGESPVVAHKTTGAGVNADVMTAAFKEYTGQSLNKDKKPSVRKKLQQAISKSLKKQQRTGENKRKGERAVIMSRLQKLLGVGKGYLERLPPVDVHKLLRIILLNLPYIMIFYVGNKLAWLYQYCAGNS